ARRRVLSWRGRAPSRPGPDESVRGTATSGRRPAPIRRVQARRERRNSLRRAFRRLLHLGGAQRRRGRSDRRGRRVRPGVRPRPPRRPSALAVSAACGRHRKLRDRRLGTRGPADRYTQGCRGSAAPVVRKRGRSVKGLCEYGNEVTRALAANSPVVALETTVVTHGLPHPEGVTTACALEQVGRDAGATPATIGVIGGAIRVGLTPGELEMLGTAPNVAKINLSNLAAAVASGQPGSTTVAATMFAAHTAGIRVFATGAIGGVHRDAAESGDVSSDLTALARIPIAVVSAGAK